MSSRILGIGKLPGDFLSDLLDAFPVSDPSVIVGPGVGMDAAAVAIGESVLVVKTDPITIARENAARYLVHVNANDLACLGATPRWMLVTALFPEGMTNEAAVRDCFVELNQVCAELGISLIGGHTEVTAGLDRTILVGQLLGTCTPERLLKPGGARPGDRILLTRPIAIEGTSLLAREMRERLAGRIESSVLDSAAAMLDSPGISVVRDAEILLATGAVTALHDPTEGGLAMGVRELASAAGAGAVIGRSFVPLLPETAAIAAALELDPLGMLASGSLLATVPASEMSVAEAACEDAQMSFAWIGKIAPAERGFTLREAESERELPVFNTDEVARALAGVASSGSW